MIKPTGWHTIKYDIVPGKYLYNRCHLIGYQLTGENKNELNLITCTRQMNTVGMLQWENKVANYIKETNNNVLYRVNPKYALIMGGQNNQYKHPNQSIIDRWINSGAKVYRTDINGNIIVLSNGDSLDIKSTR